MPARNDRRLWFPARPLSVAEYEETRLKSASIIGTYAPSGRSTGEHHDLPAGLVLLHRAVRLHDII